MSVKRLKKVEDILLLQQEKNPVVIDLREYKQKRSKGVDTKNSNE